MNRRGQVTIFVIIAVLVVVGVIIYYSVDFDLGTGVDAEVRPVYDYYLSCLESQARQGIALLGEQGGYIEPPEFEAGSSYMPFSNQLDFMGQGVPYWMYVSGNNLLREQVPTKGDMERELERYLEERIDYCDFSDFERSGYDIYVEPGEVSVNIRDLQVDVNFNNKVSMFYGDSSSYVNSHSFSVSSKLGKFYNSAMEVYNFEKSEMFLEKYALDVMRLYAPVTGTEISCEPKVFVDSEIKGDIVSGLSANIPSIRIGSGYSLSSKERDYFVVDGLDVDESVNVMYSSDWPTRIEIYGDRVALPIGIQEGLGILGFCYVPYHLVYDINFPVMIQFFDESELFQFPVGVVINKNQAREALPTNAGKSIESEVCEFKNSEVEVYTYDSNLKPVSAQISFKCLDSVCAIGETEIEGDVAVLKTGFPSCVNGFIFARAEGYADTKYQISTNRESVANIIMNRKYEIGLDLGGGVDKAVITFSSSDYSKTVLYPNFDSVELVDGDYNVSVYVYDNSSLKFPAVKDRKCVDVPEAGIGGMFGLETEKCFDIDIPEMDVTFAVVGGGKTREYITEGQLAESSELNINVPLFGVPKSVEELQINHAAVEGETIYLEFE